MKSSKISVSTANQLASVYSRRSFRFGAHVVIAHIHVLHIHVPHVHVPHVHVDMLVSVHGRRVRVGVAVCILSSTTSGAQNSNKHRSEKGSDLSHFSSSYVSKLINPVFSTFFICSVARASLSSEQFLPADSK